MQIDLAEYSSSQLSNYLSDVESIDGKDLESLEGLADQYPYCQIVQSLVAKAAITASDFDGRLQKASINAPSRLVLFNLIRHPELFENKITKDANDLSEEASTIGQWATDDQPVFIEELIEEVDIEVEPLSADEPEGIEYIATPIVESQLPVAIDFKIETYDHHDSVLIKEIEEEAIFAISNQELERHDASSSQLTAHSQSTIADIPQLTAGSPEPSSDPTLYNDDTLPFSFLWWLNKTRKEHYENNQPYKSSEVDNGQRAMGSGQPKQQPEIVYSQQLNHQIAESALQHSVLNAYKNDELQLQLVTKEDHIIEKFITQEPQIKHLPADKIDTENKAKKSSADSSELVSETLAKIYVEQMLYAKALDTYRKLSLKYPEKSTYFASQIKYLELKVN